MRRRLFLRAAATLAALGVVAGAAAGVPRRALARSPENDRALLEGLMRSHILPRAAAFAQAAQDLIAPLERLAAHPDAANLAAARGAYGNAMSAWAGLQHVRPGPLLLELRAERIAFWPDKRGVGARQVAQLLAAADEAALAPKGLARQSAAAQGLPALERLLFDDSPAAFSGETGAYRGKLAAAVARNVADLAVEVRDGWAALGPVLLAGSEATPVGKGAGEALTNLFLSLVTALQVAADQKLLMPLGAAAAEAKPAMAEAARSGRSLTQVLGNLDAMRAMLLGENGGPGLIALAPDASRKGASDKIVKTFDAAKAAVRAVSAPLDQAVADPRKRPKVEAALRAVKAAQNFVSRDLPPLLGVTLGFNELDGD